MSPERALSILGVAPGAASEQIRQAYLDLVRVWHPDRFPSDDRLKKFAEEKLKEINEAYAALDDGRGEARLDSTECVETPPVGAPRAEPAPIVVPRPMRWKWMPFAVGALLVVVVVAVAEWAGDSRRPQDFVASTTAVAVNPPPDTSTEQRQITRYVAPFPKAKPSSQEYRNGADLIAPAGRRGAGEILVHNQTDTGAVVTLASERQPAKGLREVFVSARNAAPIAGLGADVYIGWVRFGQPGSPQSPATSLGRFVIMQTESAREVRADRYEITLRTQ
jgi:hypothetical protein